MKRKVAEVATATKVAPRGATTRAAAAAVAAAAATAVTASTTGIATDVTAHATSTATATANVDSATSTGIFDRIDVLSCILSFVGPNQYRFVAPISQKFRTAYAHTFINTTITSVNTCSIAHAKICMAELKSDNLIDAHKYNVIPSMISITGRSAAYCNNLTLLQYLRSEGLAWDDIISYRAAEGGHFELLKWLHANDCPCQETSAAAADRGDVEMLTWVMDQGGHWCDDIPNEAARNGHLEVLKFSVDREYFGCSMGECCSGVRWTACHYGHMHIVHWMNEEIAHGRLTDEGAYSDGDEAQFE